MNLKALIHRIRSRHARQPELTDEVVFKFLHILEEAQAEELSCGDTYAKLDEFVENEVKSGDAGKIAPLIREHLDTCSECCDEYEALLSVIEHMQNEA